MESIESAYENFHVALRHLAEREGRGFQTFLSQKIGVSLGFINQVLKGEVKKAGFETQVKIANALGYDYLEFMKLGSRLIRERQGSYQQNAYFSTLTSFTADFKTKRDSADCLYIPFFESNSLSEQPTSNVTIAASSLRGKKGHEMRALKVTDNSMWPQIPEGSVAVIDEDDRRFLDGKIFAIKNIAEDQMVIRRPREAGFGDTNYIALMCDNPDYLPNLTGNRWKDLVIGKVILTLRNLEDE